MGSDPQAVLHRGSDPEAYGSEQKQGVALEWWVVRWGAGRVGSALAGSLGDEVHVSFRVYVQLDLNGPAADLAVRDKELTASSRLVDADGYRSGAVRTVEGLVAL